MTVVEISKGRFEVTITVGTTEQNQQLAQRLIDTINQRQAETPLLRKSSAELAVNGVGAIVPSLFCVLLLLLFIV